MTDTDASLLARLQEEEKQKLNGEVYAAVRHFAKLLLEGKSEYIRENTRHGKASAWAELLDAVDARQRAFFPERYVSAAALRGHGEALRYVQEKLDAAEKERQEYASAIAQALGTQISGQTNFDRIKELRARTALQEPKQDEAMDDRLLAAHARIRQWELRADSAEKELKELRARATTAGRRTVRDRPVLPKAWVYPRR